MAFSFPRRSSVTSAFLIGFKWLGGEVQGIMKRGQLNLKYECAWLILYPQSEQQANNGAYDGAQQKFFRS